MKKGADNAGEMFGKILSQAEYMGVLALYRNVSGHYTTRLPERRHCGILVIKQIVLDRNESLQNALTLSSVYNIIDRLGIDHKIKPVKRFRGMWIGTLGFFETWESSRSNVFHLLQMAAEVIAMSKRFGLSLSCSVDHGSIIGGFIGESKNFDMFGPEVKWAITILDEMDKCHEIFVSSSVRNLLLSKHTSDGSDDMEPSFRVMKGRLSDSTDTVHVIDNASQFARRTPTEVLRLHRAADEPAPSENSSAVSWRMLHRIWSSDAAGKFELIPSSPPLGVSDPAPASSDAIKSTFIAGNMASRKKSRRIYSYFGSGIFTERSAENMNKNVSFDNLDLSSIETRAEEYSVRSNAARFHPVTDDSSEIAAATYSLSSTVEYLRNRRIDHLKYVSSTAFGYLNNFVEAFFPGQELLEYDGDLFEEKPWIGDYEKMYGVAEVTDRLSPWRVGSIYSKLNEIVSNVILSDFAFFTGLRHMLKSLTTTPLSFIEAENEMLDNVVPAPTSTYGHLSSLPFAIFLEVYKRILSLLLTIYVKMTPIDDPVVQTNTATDADPSDYWNRIKSFHQLEYEKIRLNQKPEKEMPSYITPVDKEADALPIVDAAAVSRPEQPLVPSREAPVSSGAGDGIGAAAATASASEESQQELWLKYNENSKKGTLRFLILECAGVLFAGTLVFAVVMAMNVAPSNALGWKQYSLVGIPYAIVALVVGEQIILRTDIYYLVGFFEF